MHQHLRLRPASRTAAGGRAAALSTQPAPARRRSIRGIRTVPPSQQPCSAPWLSRPTPPPGRCSSGQPSAAARSLCSIAGSPARRPAARCAVLPPAAARHPPRCVLPPLPGQLAPTPACRQTGTLQHTCCVPAQWSMCRGAPHVRCCPAACKPLQAAACRCAPCARPQDAPMEADLEEKPYSLPTSDELKQRLKEFQYEGHLVRRLFLVFFSAGRHTRMHPPSQPCARRWRAGPARPSPAPPLPPLRAGGAHGGDWPGPGLAGERVPRPPLMRLTAPTSSLLMHDCPTHEYIAALNFVFRRGFEWRQRHGCCCRCPCNDALALAITHCACTCLMNTTPSAAPLQAGVAERWQANSGAKQIAAARAWGRPGGGGRR